MNENLRNQITRYSFILTVFVIWLHAGEPLISSIPGQIAVPGFFLLSGFLFFRVPAERPEEDQETGTEGNGEAEKKSCLVPGWIRAKLRRRVHTLLIPYLLWNLIYFLIYLIAGKAELSEIFRAVFHYSCNPVFWYLYQLILIMLITPLLWLVLKRKTAAEIWLALIFLAAVFYGKIHSLIPVELINEDALFYFSLGGFSSLYLYKEENTSEESSSRGKGLKSRDGKLFLISCGGLLLSAVLETVLPAVLINAAVIGTRVCGAAALWFLLRMLPDVPVKPWMQTTFFVYATHYMVIRAVWQAEIGLGLNEQAAANIATYLLMPALCFAAARLLYNIMKRYTPKLLALLTGGRG